RTPLPVRPRPSTTGSASPAPVNRPKPSPVAAAPSAAPAAKSSPVEARPRPVATRLTARERIVASARARTTPPPTQVPAFDAAAPAHRGGASFPPAPAPLGFAPGAFGAESQPPPGGEHEHSSVFTRAPSPAPEAPRPAEPAAAVSPITALET